MVRELSELITNFKAITIELVWPSFGSDRGEGPPRNAGPGEPVHRLPSRGNGHQPPAPALPRRPLRRVLGRNPGDVLRHRRGRDPRRLRRLRLDRRLSRLRQGRVLSVCFTVSFHTSSSQLWKDFQTKYPASPP